MPDTAHLTHIQPDYRHNLVNLMMGILQRFNSSPLTAPYPSLPLPGNRERPLLLLVIDGLGSNYLEKWPHSFLARHQIDTLSTVFPSTTASAMTTYLTGTAPQQHAITGWYTWFREIGCVTTILPFTPRIRGPSLTDAGIVPQQLIGHGPLFDTLSVPSHVIYPNTIVNSVYTQATSGRAQRHGFETLEEFFTLLLQLAKQNTPHFIFAYWSHLDALAHQHGIASSQVTHHFEQLDSACCTAFPHLAALGVDILACADHGFVDTDTEHVISLDIHPELTAMLTLPLCGEPRAAFCYVRPHKREAFEAYIREQLAHACELHPSAALLRAGYFGLGKPHPELPFRCGDYTLLMKKNFVIKDRLLNEKPFHQIGIHGGVSQAEMQVPLIVYPRE